MYASIGYLLSEDYTSVPSVRKPSLQPQSLTFFCSPPLCDKISHPPILVDSE